jgi:hypothetical protein
MAAPRKIVVHSISGLRPEFSALVADWIKEGVVFLGVVGVDAAKLEDIADDVAVGDGSDPYFLLTTSHPGETLALFVEFAELLSLEHDVPVRVIEF